MTISTIRTTENYDIAIESENVGIVFATDREAIAAIARGAMATIRGEVYYNLDEGMPYGSVAFDGLNNAEFVAAAQQILASVEGVVSVEALSVANVDNAAQYAATLLTETGTLILQPGGVQLQFDLAPAQDGGAPIVVEIPRATGCAPGPAGPATNITIGTVTTGVNPAATITGVAPNLVLNLVLPAGSGGGGAVLGAFLPLDKVCTEDTIIPSYKNALGLNTEIAPGVTVTVSPTSTLTII